MVVDDLKVTDSISFKRSREVHLWRGLACSFSVDCEVCWLAHFHTYTPLGQHYLCKSALPIQTDMLIHKCRSVPVLQSPGPSALTLLASCDGSTLIRKGLMGISYNRQNNNDIITIK